MRKQAVVHGLGVLVIRVPWMSEIGKERFMQKCSWGPFPLLFGLGDCSGGTVFPKTSDNLPRAHSTTFLKGGLYA